MDLIVGRPALLVIDMQRDFIDADAACCVPRGRDIVAPIARVVAAARGADAPVIWTREAHRASGVDVGLEADPGFGARVAGGGESDPLPRHCVEGTSGIDIVPELEVAPEEPVVDKRRYSCFFGTDLDALLKALGVETLFLTGVCTDCCVLWTAGDAHQRDYRVRVLEDCVAGNGPDPHAWALGIMRRLTTSNLLRPTAGDAIRALGAQAA